MNNGEVTFYKTSSGYKSSIDLTLSNPSLALLVCWKVLNDLRGSDHFPISIEFYKYIDKLPRSCRPFRLHNANTNWNVISARLDAISNELYDIVSNPEIDSQVKYASFMSVIGGCFHDESYKASKKFS